MTRPSALTPDTHAINAAMLRLPHGWCRGAAVHLALPVDCVVGIDARFDGEVWTWRDHSVAETGDFAADAADLAARGHRDGDFYLDLAGDPAGWVKTLRSGARRIVYGMDALFGGPLISADDDVTNAQVAAVVGARVHSGLGGVPTVVGDGENAVLVDGTAASWVVRSVSHGETEQEVCRRVDAVEPISVITNAVYDLGARLIAELGGSELETVVLGSRRPGTLDVEYLCRVGSWDVVVPATVSATCEMVGVIMADTTPAAKSTAENLPGGFTLVGEARHEQALVAEHDESCWRVLLQLGR